MPAPDGPACTTSVVNASSTGRTRSGAHLGPPIIARSRPSRAESRPPVTPPSSSVMPAGPARRCSSSISGTPTVDTVMTTRPGRAPRSRPSAAVNTWRTCISLKTATMTTSQRRARSAALAAIVDAPNGAIFSRLGSRTTRGQPARIGRTLQDWPVLAWERARFMGDRVAAVAADTVAQAEAAVGAIEVDYEELPAVFTTDDALAPDAPVLHPDASEYAFLRGTREPVPHPNAQGAVRYEHGDIAAAFRRSVRLFEHEFEVARIFPGALEPRASVAWMDGDTLNVKSTNKSPFALRGQMASGLGVPAEKIVIDAGFIGGGVF